MGAAGRPRPDLHRRGPEGLEGRRGRMVARRTIPARRWSRSRRRSPTGSGSRSATRSSSTCSAATSPARIANLRNVDWQGLGINFVLVFSPNAFRGAPHTHVATLTESIRTPAGDARIIKAVADAFPTVTSVRVREALETVGAVVTNLVLAIRGASAVTLISAILVLGGALAAGHRHRVYDAVILKTLGATRGAAARRLRAGIPDDRPRHRGVRRARRLARGLADRDPVMTLELRLAGRQRRRRGRRGPDRHGRARPRRHVAGAEPEAGQRVAEFVTICSGGKAAVNAAFARRNMPLRRATFSRAWKLAVECVSFPHTAWVGCRFGDAKSTSANRTSG